MVLLVAKIGKLYTKLENHHGQHHLRCKSEQALSSALEAFRSDVSNGLNKLSVNSKPRLEILSFPWIQQCFELISIIINKAFANLVMDIDYPMNKWEAASAEEYLKYSLNLLQLFNSISSSISNLGQFRFRISHALSLVEESPSLAAEHLKKASQPMNYSNKEFKKNMNKEDGKGKSYSGKERVIHEAMMVMESIGFWVCGILLSGLCGDEKPYSEMRKFSSGLVVFSSFPRLDSSVCEAIMEKKSEFVELKELKDAEACLVAAIDLGKSSRDAAAEELQRRLEKFEKLLEGLGKEIDHLFMEVLTGRNQLLKSLQQRKTIIS